MRKDAKKTSKKQAKKADVKDLAAKNAAAVKGGKVAVQDLTIMKTYDKASSTLMTGLN